MNTAPTTEAAQPGQEAAAMIRTALDKPNLSGPKVAKASLLSVSVVYCYRDGVTVPRERDCDRLAKALGIDAAALVEACDRDRANRRKAATGGAA